MLHRTGYMEFLRGSLIGLSDGRQAPFIWPVKQDPMLSPRQLSPLGHTHYTDTTAFPRFEPQKLLVNI